MLGTVHEKYAVEHFKKSKIIIVNSGADLMPSLVNGKADVAITNGIVAEHIIKKDNRITVFVPCLETEHVGFIFNKKRKDIKNKFNVFFRKLQASGEFAKIVDKWAHHANSAHIPKLKNDGSGGRVVLACTASGPPYVLMKDGEMGGSDIEMAERFASAYNMKMEIVIANFSGIISGVATGKFDMAGNEMSITDERAKVVDFSIPYDGAPIAAIARKQDIYDQTDDNGKIKNSGFIKDVEESFYNNVIAEKRYMLLADGLWTTAVISVLSSFFGTILGVLLCFFRMRHNRYVQKTVSYIVDFLRGIPPVVLLMILFYIIFTSPDVSAVLVSIISFSLIFAGYVSEMFRTSVESVDNGQWEAGLSMGFTKTQTFRYFIMPLAIERALPVYKGEFIGLIKNTAIVGYIAVQDLTKAGDIIRSATFDPFFPLILVTIIYFLLIWLLTRIISLIRIRTAAIRHSL